MTSVKNTDCIPKSFNIDFNKTIEIPESEVKVYKDDGRITIGEEIPTSISIGGLTIPLCFNCLEKPAVTGSLCSICRDLEKDEDVLLHLCPFCDKDLIETNSYTQEQK